MPRDQTKTNPRDAALSAKLTSEECYGFSLGSDTLCEGQPRPARQ